MTGRSLRRFLEWRLSEVEGVEVVEVVEGVEEVERFITGNVLSYYHTAQKFFCNHTLVTH